MHLLQSSVAPEVIAWMHEPDGWALWLGHESIETTHSYIEADLELKKRTVDKLPSAGARIGRLQRAGRRRGDSGGR